MASEVSEEAQTDAENEQAFPTQTVDFGWQDAVPLTGRRKAKEKALKKKLKPGSFGMCNAITVYLPCVLPSSAALQRYGDILNLVWGLLLILVQRQWA